MIDVNVFDMVISAIEEYNNYVRNNPKVKTISDCERRGLFYNVLRRTMGNFGHHRDPYGCLRVNDLVCDFTQEGLLVSYRITKNFMSSRYSWEISMPHDRIAIMRAMKQIGERIKYFYPTKTLNEMALIVNSIKQ